MTDETERKPRRITWTAKATALVVLGGLLVTSGAAWIYPPAGLIVAGSLLLVGGVGAFL